MGEANILLACAVNSTCPSIDCADARTASATLSAASRTPGIASGAGGLRATTAVRLMST